MTTHLREELDRLADTQPAFRPDPSTWDRGRRARRRSRIASGAAALAVVAVVGGLGAQGLGTGSPSPAAGEVPAGAIPRRIADIPSDLRTTSPADGLGTASAAFVSSAGDPVVVTATDGQPHRLDLPGWAPHSAGLALAPDGGTLAWEQDVPGEDGTHLGVLDLGSGDVTLHLLRPESFRLRELSWSPDSSWVAYVGDLRTGGGGSVVGRVDVEGGLSEPLDPRDGTGREAVGDLAVSSDGATVVSRPWGGLYRVGRAGSERLTDRRGVGPGAWSPDGRHLALRSSPSEASYTLDAATGEVLTHPFADPTLGLAAVRPMGWLDDRRQLLLAEGLLGGTAELVVTTPTADATSTWRRSVGTIEAGPAATVSLAVDLVPDLDGTSSQALTHDFPASDERDVSWLIGLGVAAAIAALMALRWLWRRLAAGRPFGGRPVSRPGEPEHRP